MSFYWLLTTVYCLLHTPLPHLAAILLGSHHRVAGLAAVGGGELWHVRERAVDAEADERVRVGLRDEARELGRVLRRPDLRPPEEEALLGRQAVDALGARL